MEEKWQKEFFERFGANKIWVNPSKDNVETVLEIWAFITHAIEAHDREIAEKVKKVSWETNDLPGGKLVTLDEVLSLINKQI